eukprot:TRINITY_DN8923_c0_g1_i2.p1 TRINITY_DN8923_c0_g1~~TRINITY_DN8923_c0_g1_i2.p1  ORF type:complete len:111 (+),score=18.74 TRINITY_DN8923_c0_g1_i2:30-362(+)
MHLGALRKIQPISCGSRAFLLHRDDDSSSRIANTVAEYIHKRFSMQTMIQSTQVREDVFHQSQSEIPDLAICFGGDGTLLHASRLFQQTCPPILSFCTGSVGFLIGNGEL